MQRRKQRDSFWWIADIRLERNKHQWWPYSGTIWITTHVVCYTHSKFDSYTSKDFDKYTCHLPLHPKACTAALLLNTLLYVIRCNQEKAHHTNCHKVELLLQCSRVLMTLSSYIAAITLPKFRLKWVDRRDLYKQMLIQEMWLHAVDNEVTVVQDSQD